MKKVSLLLVLAFMTMAAFAQESGKSAEAGRKATFERNGFWDNWFVGAGVGANIYFGDKQDNKASFFGSRPTASYNGQVGKWFNPYLGVRGKGSFGSIHTFVGDNAQSMMHQKNISAQVDVLADLTNYFGKYNENRFYNLIVFGGVGGAVSFDAKMNGIKQDGKRKSLTINAGIINRFRLTERLGLELEIAGSILPDDHDQQPSGTKYDGLLNTSLGLTYKIGKAGFNEAILADQATIDGLNAQINKLRQDNAILSKRPEKCDKCPEQKVIKQEATNAAFVSNVVFFRINSAVIDKHQEVNVYNTAQYMKENPSAKVKIVGYADKKTGTASINQKLSERRAKAVANELIKKHNISESRVSVDWKGDTVQPYAENAWNRVAIFYAD